MNNEVTKIVNLHYHCKKCKYRGKCMFWDGTDPSYRWEFCSADDFAKGVDATLRHLGKIPTEGITRIIHNYKNEKYERKTRESSQRDSQ